MRAKDVCSNDLLTSQEKWRAIIGTENEGQLPEYKVNQHVGHCWASCPYDSEATELRTRHLLGLSETDPLPTRVSHVDNNGTSHYMKTSDRGGWGYECTYSGCPSLLVNGMPYFYK